MSATKARGSPKGKADQPQGPEAVLVAAVREWWATRQSTVAVAQEIVTLRNQASYLASGAVTAALGAVVQPARMALQTHESLAGRIKQLREKQRDMLACLERAVGASISRELTEESSSSNSNNSGGGEWMLDGAFESSLLDQMKQQTLLELCAAETLTMGSGEGKGEGDGDGEGGGGEEDGGALFWGDDLSIEPDTATTLLLCFSHPPYLTANIESV